MGKKDIVTCEYLKDKEVFADVLNLALFSGDKVVEPENVEELDGSERHSIPSASGKRQPSIKKDRDILRKVTIDNDSFCTRLIAGVEHQSDVHYAMPVRDMLYDSLKYTQQVKEKTKKNRKERSYTDSAEFLSGMRKGEKLTPIITIVVYLQPEKWDGPMSLHDMLDFGELSDEVTELIPDYKMVLLQPENYSEKQSKNMQSSLGIILGLLNCTETKEDFQRYLDSHEKELESLSESAMAVLNEYCELNIPEKEIEEGEVVDMCKAVREIREEARNEGRSEGIIEGKREGILEGKREGILEGKSEGKREGKIEILHELGYTISDIAERLKCTEKEVSKVLAAL